jgi:hypothetical protein
MLYIITIVSDGRMQCINNTKVQSIPDVEVFGSPIDHRLVLVLVSLLLLIADVVIHLTYQPLT